jgi:hypothetical protein
LTKIIFNNRKQIVSTIPGSKAPIKLDNFSGISDKPGIIVASVSRFAKEVINAVIATQKINKKKIMI